MQIFGLVSLIITIAVGVWWVNGNGSVGGITMQNEDGSQDEVTYKDAIDSAREAAGSISGNSVLSGKNVEVYEGISVSENTPVLDLSGKGMSGSLKAEIRHLTKLRELDISNNNFTGLPAEIGQLSDLEVLNMADNRFTGLPLELGNLQKLKVLDLRGNGYSSYDLSLIKEELSSGTQVLVD